MDSNGFITIPDWMLELELDIYETVILATIFGFSQDGDSRFSGSINYLARRAKCGRTKVISSLRSLLEKGLIEKFDVNVRGVHLCEYKFNGERGVREANGGSTRGVPNNKRDIDISSIDIEDNSPKRFPFKKSLIEIGVSKEVADAWMAVRKKKRATNSEIAFNAICREINLAGLSADQAIRIAVEKSWSGFDHSWLEKERKVAPKKESVFEQNLRNLDTMFGTDFHAQAYGNNQVNNNNYDDQ